MKKYKVNGIIVEGNTCLDAISKIKDEDLFMIVDKGEGAYIYNIKSNSNSILSYDTTYNSKLASKFSKQEAKNVIKKLENNIDWKNQFTLSEFMDDSNTKDSINYEYLLSEERKAVEDYKKAISETNDKNELYVLSHILKEEAHHIELLENLQKGKVTFNDSIKDEDKYVVYAEETWDNYRALFKKNSGSAKYSSEADADKFTKEEAERLAKPTSNYNWVKKKV